jgi:hypothetical protein
MKAFTSNSTMAKACRLSPATTPNSVCSRAGLIATILGRGKLASVPGRCAPMARILRATAIVVSLSLGLPACSDFLDALVFNPCADAASVSFSGVLPALHWLDETQVGAGRVVRVRNVFSHAEPGAFEYARATFESGDKVVFSVPMTDDDPVPVLIPTDKCP